MHAEVRETVATAESQGTTEMAGLLGWLRRALPTSLVLVTLSGIAIWGHSTEWEFGWHLRANSGEVAKEAPQKVSITFGAAITMTTDLPAVLRRQIGLTYASAEAMEKAGIEVAPVWTAPMTDAIAASGELSFDPSRFARLAPRSHGAIWKVFKKQGATVEAGEVLALIESADVGKAKADLEQAIVQVRLRQKAVNNLRKAGAAVPERQAREAEASLREADVQRIAAVQVLVNLGLPVQAIDFDPLSLDDVVDRLRGLGIPANSGFDEKAGTANLLPVRAPFSGVVLNADAVVGEVVDTGRVLFVVVDPKQLWLTVHVPQDQSRRVVVDQVIKFKPDGGTSETVSKVAWIGTTADETTRTVPVRADMANGKGELRASTLGQGRIVIRETPEAIVVPRESVQLFHGIPIVFVRHPNFLKPEGPKELQVRVVQVGASDATNTEIINGVQLNEIVASKGANLLVTELTRLTQSAAPSR